MDRVDTALMLAMLCLMAGTLLVGFSRPLWWMLHKRGPDGQRRTPPHYEWLMRIPGLALLAAEAFLLFLGILGWNRCAMAADILQILSGVLAVRIMVIDPEFFVGLAAFIVLMVLGIIGLLPPGRR